MFARAYRQNRKRTDDIFSMTVAEAYHDAPIPLRHPLVFYHGHLPAFSFLTLNRNHRGEEAIDTELEELFRRGIDPESSATARSVAIDRWPARERIERFITACDERVLRVLDEGKPSDALAVHTILEHEAMHHETLMYIVHQLAYGKKHAMRSQHHDDAPPRSEAVSIPRGIAVLGRAPDDARFSWDNERGQLECAVEAFAIDRFNVTNAEWLAFVADGGPTPFFWERADGSWYLRGCFERIPLPLSWPVYVTLEQAQAYARWQGALLPTEAQYHRAAYATPYGETRSYPWGESPPESRHGNFDFARFDPEPVHAKPAGASAWGVEGLVGNGWEWTSTPFAPFPGFTPMPTYERYSIDFFDGRHYVLKGASPVTPRSLIRSSFRNWFYPDYPYVYATFRCVR